MKILIGEDENDYYDIYEVSNPHEAIAEYAEDYYGKDDLIRETILRAKDIKTAVSLFNKFYNKSITLIADVTNPLYTNP